MERIREKVSGGNRGWLWLIVLLAVFAGARSSAAYDVYVGTQGGQNGGGGVYRYDGGAAWSDLSAGASLGKAVMDLVFYGGKLYAATQTEAGTGGANGLGQVWRYDGGTTWTKVGEMGSSVMKLVVYRNELYAVASVSENYGFFHGALYQYDGASGAWTIVGEDLSASRSGFFSAIVSSKSGSDEIVIGDMNIDKWQTYSPETGLVVRQDSGGSCVWDFADYNGVLYSTHDAGLIYGTTDARTWTLAAQGDANYWSEAVFKGKMYLAGHVKYYCMGWWCWTPPSEAILDVFDGVEVKKAWRYRSTAYQDGLTRLAVNPDGSLLYIGTGVREGYDTGDGVANVWTYDGVNYRKISTNDFFGGGVQALLATDANMTQAAIDIRPGESPNSVNVQNKGTVQVAVLTTPGLNAASVDPATARFARGAAPTGHALRDADADGDLDLVLGFDTQSLGLLPGDESVMLRASLYDGTRIFGSDSVIVVMNSKTRKIVSTARHNVGISDCDVSAVSGNIIAISMDESEDSIDYNNDEDTWDRVLGYYDITTKQKVNTGISISTSVAIDGDTIVFELLHGDNRWDPGRTLAYYSIRTGAMTDTGILASWETWGGYRGPTRIVSGKNIVYAARIQDLNGDGYNDPEICVYDIKTGISTCKGIPGSNPSISGNTVAFQSPVEVGYFNINTWEVKSTGVSGWSPIVDKGIIAIESSEGVGYYDISARSYVETPLRGAFSISLSNGVISALVDERNWGADLNGDGDTDDNYMVMAYDIRSGAVISTGVQGCCGTDISNGVIVFDTYEGEQDIQTDYNGDGDTGDCVQQYVVIEEVLALRQ